MQIKLASILLVAAATTAAAGPDFVDHGRARGVPRALAASQATTLETPYDDVEFTFDSTGLTAGASAQIRTAASWLAQHPDQTMVLEGHTDSVGTAAYNDDLALRRLRAVAVALTGNGIPAERVVFVVYGDAEAEHRPSATDRRVVMFTTAEPRHAIIQAALDRRKAHSVLWTDHGAQLSATVDARLPTVAGR